ncbi:MAG: glycosyltransferase family 39 protein [Deltaproteobacteria bacterium]|nr:glycosyltransferase family 39 protein [Deltaproteobacteria bacterium]
MRDTDAPAGMPTLTDLGMGELPFTSMAVGFRLFGLHDWSGRLPLALWAVAGALVLFVFLQRTVGGRAGLYGVVALATMPLYFMQARTMLGDVVTMAAAIACFCGLAGALLDRGSKRATAAWLLVGLVGGAAGYLSRGAVIGVAAPALGVGMAWLVLSLADAGAASSCGRLRWHGIGAGSLCLGVVFAYLGMHALLEHGWQQRLVLRSVGFAVVAKAPVESTFELTIRDLGHALFPWSAFVPCALGRLFAWPAGIEPMARQRQLGVRVALLLGAAFFYAAFAVLAPWAGSLPFAGPGLLAAIAAVAIDDYERGAEPSGAVAVGTALLGGVLLGDMLAEPVKGLAAFGVPETAFPKGFEPQAARLMQATAAVFAGLVVLSWLERGLECGRERLGPWLRRRWAQYRSAGAEIGRLWNGNLVFGLLVVEAALVGLGAMLLVGRRLQWTSVLRLPQNFAYGGLNAWWVLPVAVCLVPLGFELGRGLLGAGLRLVRLPRGALSPLAALVAGGVLSFGYYPALAAQLSPKEVFESYSRLHAPGEPLGVAGLRARAARYYSGGEQVSSFASARAAYRWLTAPAAERGADPERGERRFLALRDQDLAECNSLYREQFGRNLPVLDARSSSILLASNQLRGAVNANAFAPFFLFEPPPIQHAVAAQLEDELDALGWEVADAEGRLVEYVVPQRRYRLRFFFRVLKPIGRSWQAFLHIDGQRRRHNGDRDPLGGKYAMTLWRTGDVVVDEYAMALEPNFTPGRYTVYYGFYSGSTRMRVTKGRHHENRVDGGELVVR